VGQPSMPEIRESTQLLYQKPATLSSRIGARRVVDWVGYLPGVGGRKYLWQPSAMVALPAAIAVTSPHAIVLIIVSVVVTGLVGAIGKYLLFYARNRRARSIAEIRRAAIEGKIAVSDAEKLIRADIETDADHPQQLGDDDATGTKRGADDDGQDASGRAAGGSITLMLRRLHLR
jgi:hypothetical protein